MDDFYLGSRDRSKSPLFDQISIPFIDASLPPTPKTGRSAEALQILLGRRSLDGSSSSLSGTDNLAVFNMQSFCILVCGIMITKAWSIMTYEAVH